MTVSVELQEALKFTLYMLIKRLILNIMSNILYDELSKIIIKLIL